VRERARERCGRCVSVYGCGGRCPLQVYSDGAKSVGVASHHHLQYQHQRRRRQQQQQQEQQQQQHHHTAPPID
jgi:sulfatase maturation enzyme AslB (radical SAM superfamily)